MKDYQFYLLCAIIIVSPHVSSSDANIWGWAFFAIGVAYALAEWRTNRARA